MAKKKVEEKGTPEAVKAGEVIEFIYEGSRPSKESVTIKEPCEDKNNGYWYCTTHQKGFENNLQKDIHLDIPGIHRLAWMCRKHGAEQP